VSGIGINIGQRPQNRRQRCNYLSTAIQKLAVRNRAEAVRIAREKGWL
jgi:hypothetical protein